MNEHELMEFLTTDTEVSDEKLTNDIAGYINDLILNDFNKLVALLYRIDINEEKLKKLLKETTGEDAGAIIARLIIERQSQKIASRKKFRS